MHYTTRVQIAQEQQIAGMLIETNRQQIEAQIKNEEPSATVVGMAAFLRNLALAAPHRQRANTNTFPGSNPNPVNPTPAISTFEEVASLAQRPVCREIPDAGAGQLLKLRGDGLGMPNNSSRVQDTAKIPEPRAA